MTTSAILETHPPSDVFKSLEGVCHDSGLGALAGRLGELRPWLEGDLVEVEQQLRTMLFGETPAEQSARHLIQMPGKRLRPLCVALAAHMGAGFGREARELAVAVELVHNATLLHDDVVDLGDLRRGAPAARSIYGNAASIFGGDWLLVEALCRVERAAVPGVLEKMLLVIKEMVIAESNQLAARGRLSLDREAYFAIVRGKTASLFRWAMFAGARAGHVSEAQASSLARYGEKLGMAFQVIDDLLDVVGDPTETGKSALADLREGKMTYPLLLAVELDPSLRGALERASEAGELGLAPIERRVARAMEDGRVEAGAREFAERLIREAIDELSELSDCPAKTALASVAIATLGRRK